MIFGVAVLCIAWLGPWRELAETAFMPHMAMHVSVVAVAAPLMAAGLVGSRLYAIRMPPFLLAPVPASLVEFVVVWGWHFPALHHLARESTGAFVAEQASFLAAGLLLWCSALRRPKRSDERGAGVLALLLTSMHMILLGTLLALAPRPLYHQQSPSAGNALLADQQLGGMLMLAGGGVPYLLGALWLVWGLLHSPHSRESGPKSGGSRAAPPAELR
jgi:putative membrane protein